MTNFVIRATVFLVVWVEMGPSRHATVRAITELMNVEPVQTGFQAFNRAGHLNSVGFRLEENMAHSRLELLL